MLLSEAKVFGNEHRRYGSADGLGHSRVVQGYRHIEPGQLGGSLLHGPDRGHFDGLLEAANQVLHRNILDLVRIQPELRDNWLEPGAAEDLLFHARKALADVFRHYRSNKVPWHCRLFD